MQTSPVKQQEPGRKPTKSRNRKRRAGRQKAMAEEDYRMSFWSHLTELRKRIVYTAIAIGIGFMVCFNFSEDILGVLLLPMNSTMTYQATFPFLHFEPNKTAQD